MRALSAALLIVASLALPREGAGQAVQPLRRQGGASSGKAEQELVEVAALSLAISGRAPAGGSRLIGRFRDNGPGKLLPSAKFSVVASVCNRMAWQRDFLVWTSIESLVAPAVRDFATGRVDPTAGSISWGWMAELKDIRSKSIYSLANGACKKVSVGPFDLEPMMRSFDEPDSALPLWPWALRITLHVATREGKEVGSRQEVVRIEPRSDRVRDVSPKEMRIILGQEGGEPISIVPNN
jgi:hypothetical protein